jgi:outer membrane lipoprotein-sorting protein
MLPVMQRRTALSVFLLGLTLTAGTTAGSAHADDLSAADVMQKAEQARRVRDLTAEASLTTEADGRTKVKTFTLWTALSDDGVHYRTLARFHTPAVIRNEGVLILEGAAGNDVHLYLPRYKKVRRVESSSQSSSFMGSVFSYSDIAVQHAAEWDHVRERTEPCPGADGTCHVIASTPKTPAIRSRTGYGKAVQWVRDGTWVVMRGAYYGPDGTLSKVTTASEVVKVASGPDRWLALSMRIEDTKTRRFTVLRLRNVQVDKGIADSVFTQQNLAREHR